MILAKKIQDRARRGNRMDVVQIFERRAHEAEQQSSMIRQLLLGEKNQIAEPVLQGND